MLYQKYSDASKAATKARAEGWKVRIVKEKVYGSDKVLYKLVKG